MDQIEKINDLGSDEETDSATCTVSIFSCVTAGQSIGLILGNYFVRFLNVV